MAPCGESPGDEEAQGEAWRGHGRKQGEQEGHWGHRDPRDSAVQALLPLLHCYQGVMGRNCQVQRLIQCLCQFLLSLLVVLMAGPPRKPARQSRDRVTGMSIVPPKSMSTVSNKSKDVCSQVHLFRKSPCTRLHHHASESVVAWLQHRIQSSCCLALGNPPSPPGGSSQFPQTLS